VIRKPKASKILPYRKDNTRIAHGTLLGGLISTVIRNQPPGPRSMYLKQELQFLGPVRIGERVVQAVERDYDSQSPDAESEIDLA
jgi:acyl dehydratase